MRRDRTILLAALALTASVVATTTGSAQKDEWQSKPYQQWTKKDVQQVLGDSPWAQTQVRSGPMVSFGGGGTMTPTPDKVYTIRLRSALPVRQALLRLRQLNEKYDEMSDKKKAEFDEKNKILVECPACADNYAISLIPPGSGDARFVTAEKMKLYVQLADERGRRRELVYLAPTKTTGQEIVFFFPRLDAKGEPLLTPSSKKLIFSIDTSVLGLDATIRLFEFDVSKMIANGAVVF
jgi:hypothetical protein